MRFECLDMMEQPKLGPNCCCSHAVTKDRYNFPWTSGKLSFGGSGRGAVFLEICNVRVVKAEAAEFCSGKLYLHWSPSSRVVFLLCG